MCCVADRLLRPHQREGVRFMAECVLKQRAFNGSGAILADDMGLGKTLQSISLLYTLLRQGTASDITVHLPLLSLDPSLLDLLPLRF
jgi:SNF2 family DNA or RNA helicase